MSSISEQQIKLLQGASRSATITFFTWLMFQDLELAYRPFMLDFDRAESELGMNRRRQLRALRKLAELGLVTVERQGRYGAPHN